MPKVLGAAPTATTHRSYCTSNLVHSPSAVDSHETTRAAASIWVASASKYCECLGIEARIGSMIERGSSVPSAAPASIGVKRK
eukprot:scaffold215359_cov30-Tisochrysis_lutea.AAC.1